MEEQVEQVRAAYAQAGVKATVESFFSDMQNKPADCYMIIARALAHPPSPRCATIAGRQSILILLAIATNDHQTANAEGMVTGCGSRRGARAEIHRRHAGYRC